MGENKEREKGRGGEKRDRFLHSVNDQRKAGDVNLLAHIHRKCHLKNAGFEHRLFNIGVLALSPCAL